PYHPQLSLLHYIRVSCLLTAACLFFFACYGDHRDLHSFPTRRSSDLPPPPVRSARPSPAPTWSPRPRPSPSRSGWPARRWSGSGDRKSTRLNSSHVEISYAVFCLKKKTRHELRC